MREIRAGARGALRAPLAPQAAAAPPAPPAPPPPPPPHTPPPPPTRRAALAALALLPISAAARAQAQDASAAPPATLFVGAGGAYAAIGAAVAVAPQGATVLVAAGTYRERVVVDTPGVAVAAAPGAAVTLVWETAAPYEAALELRAAGAAARGLTVRHASPSVADNYAVRLSGPSARLEDCDVSSSTGSGLGAEPGAHTAARCRFHGCARSGAMLFGAAGEEEDEGGGGGAASATLEDCALEGNRLHGLLVRGGAPAVRRCALRANGGFGLALQSCGGAFEGNALGGNGRGDVAVDLLRDGLDAAALAAANGLEPRAVRAVALRGAG